MARKRRRKLSIIERLNLNPDINRGLLAILLFIAGGLATLSFFSMAGVAGQFIDALLAITFGQVRFVFPVILLLVSILIIKDLDYDYQPTHWLGSILFFVSFNGIVHLHKPVENMVDLAIQGQGGGLVGLILSWPLGTYIGYYGGLITLIGLILISIIFLFNTSLTEIVHLHRKLFYTLGWFGKQIIKLFALFKKDKSDTKFKINGKYSDEIIDEDDEEDEEEFIDDEEDEEDTSTFSKKTIEDIDEDDDDEEIEEIKRKPRVIIRDLPPLKLLYTSKEKPTAGDVKANAETIKETLANFGIDVTMGEVQVGPTVSQYSLKPAKGVKLARITALSNDLALALAAHPIRIEAPIPKKSLVGIEVPNQKVAMVTLRELLESKEWKKRPSEMQIALGKDVAGKVWFADLPKMPHLLVAGATGSGKTVCINTILLSLLYQNDASTLRMILVDPKRVELTMYNGIPHLLTPVITDAKKTVNALRWTINEMGRRFDLLSLKGKRDITTYNSVVSEEDRLPRIIFVIDELADLMATTATEVEAGIIRLAQMARAVGIHLIVATQRPSVEVITGLMKANIPARIAFSVASSVDSRTILDCPGADKLLGRGDMLYLTAELSAPKRIQGSFVSEQELQRVIKYLKGDETPEYDESITGTTSGSDGGTMSLFGDSDDDNDPKFNDAKRIIIESGKASASLLQRRMKIGYARAARILDELEEAGIVGPADGAKPRELFTEHLMPEPEPELDDKKQTMDSGGSAVFDDVEDDDESEEEETEEETDEEDAEEDEYIEEETSEESDEDDEEIEEEDEDEIEDEEIEDDEEDAEEDEDEKNN